MFPSFPSSKHKKTSSFLKLSARLVPNCATYNKCFVHESWSKEKLVFFYLGFLSSTSRFTRQQGKGEGIYLTPLYHFHPLHRHLDISREITAESSPLHIDLWIISPGLYGVNLRIQSEYWKIRTRNNSVFGNFSRSYNLIYNLIFLVLLGRRCERNDSNKRPHKMLILKINGSIFIRAFIVNSSKFMLEIYLRR